MNTLSQAALSPAEVAKINALVTQLQTLLQAAADPERARPMADYMQTDMPFYGVQAVPRAAILRTIIKGHTVESQAEYEATVLAVWQLPHREEKYGAITLARQYKRYITPASLPLYERMIREGAWWDFVDEIAQHLVGMVLLNHRSETWAVLDRWILDPDKWIRRTAILAQNRLKRHTNPTQLFRYVQLCKEDSDFFIRKAIGWALREYAYVDPDAVKSFLEANKDTLSPLSYREASKHLRM